MSVYKKLNNVKYYNRNGEKIDPFCHEKFSSLLEENIDDLLSAFIEYTYGDLIYLTSSTLNIGNYYEAASYSSINGWQSQVLSVDVNLRSSNDSIDIDYNSTYTNYVDLKVDLRSDDSSVNISQEIDPQTDKTYFNLEVESENVDFSHIYAALDEKVNKVEVQNLNTNGLRAQGFSINYGRNDVWWQAATDTYIPICTITSTNLGKFAVGFEILGREDSFGYSARYYASGRKMTDAVSGPDAMSGTIENNVAQYNYAFLGCCSMVASIRESIFNPADIVIVEQGHKRVSNVNTSQYTIYRKVRKGGNNASDFFIINVLYQDTPNYCTIKWYYTSPVINKYNSLSLFPAIGEETQLYVDTSTNKVYRYNTTSNTYNESTAASDLRAIDPNLIGLPGGQRDSSAANIGVTTYTDIYDNTDKSISTHGFSAVFS